MFPRRVTSVLGLAVAAATTGCATSLPMTPVFQAKPAPVERTALAKPSGTAAGHYAIGAMELAAGRHASAVARFRAALELDPRHVEALNGIGVAYGETGRHGEALASFEQALAIAPDSAHVLSNLGYAQLRAGRADDAWRSLSRAFELDPSSARTRVNLLSAMQAREKAAPEPAPANSVRIESASGEGTSMRVEPTMRIGPTAAASPAAAVQPAPVPAAPVQAASPPPSPAPAAAGVSESNAPFTVVTNRAQDPGLVRVAENVYELRPVERTVAAAVPARKVGTATAPVPVRKAEAPAVFAPAAAPVPLQRLEVSNGTGVSRLATRTAAELARLGYPKARLTNALPFGTSSSQVLYRPGHESQARELADAMGVQVRLVPSAGLAPSVDVRLVLGLDLATWEQTARLSGSGLARVPAAPSAPAAAPAAPAAIATAETSRC